MQDFSKKLVEFIAKEMMPLSIVESESFKELIHFCDPRITIPSRSTLSTSWLPNLYKEKKDELINQLQQVESVALTTDMWTSRTNEGFLTVTAHFIDNEMQFFSKVLSTVNVPENHTSANIALRLTDVINTWELDRKVTGIVTDNAANMMKAVSDMKLMQISCFAHTLNLVVTSSIKSVALVESVLKKSRELVTFLHKSSTAQTKLNLHCDLIASYDPSFTKIRKLKQDVSTRWNSSLIMICSIKYLKDPVVSTLAQLGMIRKNLSEEEWNMIDNMIEILVPFEHATTDISSSNYVSVSKVNK